jgi:hypothetical protein
MRLIDSNHNWMLEQQEFINNSLIESLFAPDVTFSGKELLSVGIGIHLTPCESGTCAVSTIADRCFDRVQDGNESDVDCGGTCAVACAGGAHCLAPSDCDSQYCGAGGICGAPSCSDQVIDGFESDVDCGGACGPCALGKMCNESADCPANHVCSGNRCY